MFWIQDFEQEEGLIGSSIVTSLLSRSYTAARGDEKGGFTFAIGKPDVSAPVFAFEDGVVGVDAIYEGKTAKRRCGNCWNSIAQDFQYLWLVFLLRIQFWCARRCNTVCLSPLALYSLLLNDNTSDGRGLARNLHNRELGAETFLRKP